MKVDLPPLIQLLEHKMAVDGESKISGLFNFLFGGEASHQSFGVEDFEVGVFVASTKTGKCLLKLWGGPG
jgi:hypothetical protein